MTRTEADQIAKRIINVWRGGPPHAEWVDVLEPLDVGTAGTALARLRNKLDQAPTIAQFLTEYRSLHTPANQPYNDGCSSCKHGWRTIWWDTDGNQIIALNDEPPTDAHRGVAPCECPTGRSLRPTWAAITEHNTNTLRRTLGTHTGDAA